MFAPPGDPTLVTVAATVLSAFGTMGLAAAWVEGRLSKLALGNFLLGTVLFLWLALSTSDGFDPVAIPEAFVELIARILR